MEVSDYENIDKFQYRGMIPSAHEHVHDAKDKADGKTEAEMFCLSGPPACEECYWRSTNGQNRRWDAASVLRHHRHLGGMLVS